MALNSTTIFLMNEIINKNQQNIFIFNEKDKAKDNWTKQDAYCILSLSKKCLIVYRKKKHNDNYTCSIFPYDKTLNIDFNDKNIQWGFEAFVNAISEMDNSSIKISLVERQSYSEGVFDNLMSTLKYPEKLIINTKKGEIDLSQLNNNVDSITINNVIIDNQLLLELHMFFPKNETIYMNNCLLTDNIKEDNLNFFKNYNFSHMKIERMEKFNKIAGSLWFSNCTFDFNCADNNLESHEMQCKFLNFKHCDLDFNRLFLTKTAPNLKKLTIKALDHKDKNNNYKYIPFFSPKLESISIDGQVNDLEFLRNLYNLHDIEIASKSDGFGMLYPHVNSEEELKYLKEKYQKRSEKFKEYYNYDFDDERYIYFELNEIIARNHFYEKITDDNKRIKELYNFQNYKEYILSKEFFNPKGLYLSGNKKFQHFDYHNIPEEARFFYQEGTSCIKLYSSYSQQNTKGKCILNYDGKMIVFYYLDSIYYEPTEQEFIEKIEDQIKREKTYREAHGLGSASSEKRYTDEDFYRDEEQEYIKNFFNHNKDTDIRDLKFCAEEYTGVKMCLEDIKNHIFKIKGLEFFNQYLDGQITINRQLNRLDYYKKWLEYYTFDYIMKNRDVISKYNQSELYNIYYLFDKTDDFGIGYLILRRLLKNSLTDSPIKDEESHIFIDETFNKIRKIYEKLENHHYLNKEIIVPGKSLVKAKKLIDDNQIK